MRTVMPDIDATTIAFAFMSIAIPQVACDIASTRFFYLKIIVAETLGVMDVLLRLFDYLCHRADCLDRIFTRGRFAGEHDRTRAVVDSVRNVGNFRSRRAGIGYH